MRRPRRVKPPYQKSSALYRRVWREVDMAVADAFARHPEYLAPSGQRFNAARRSVNKRVVGALKSFLERELPEVAAGKRARPSATP